MRCSTHTSVHQPPTEVLRTPFVKLSWMCWHGRILEEAPGNYPLGGSESRNRSMPHLYTWRHWYIYSKPSLARLVPLCVVITESHTGIQETFGHVPVSLRAYSYLLWLTDSNTKVYGLHALMFMTEATANHRIHRGRSQSSLIMTAIMSFMYYKAHKVKAELHSKADIIKSLLWVLICSSSWADALWWQNFFWNTSLSLDHWQTSMVKTITKGWCFLHM